VDLQIRITEAALADFEGIPAYSWANFPATAERFGNAILNHIELLRSFPYVGSRVKGRPGVRQRLLTG
jgi:plasmid stabilization system protein ParE